MSRAQRTAPAAYTAILAASAACGLPRSFQTDMTTHDRAAIANHPTRAFFWAAYASGTHLMWADDSASTYEQARKFCGLMRDMGEVRMFLWDGVALLPFTSAERFACYSGGASDDYAA